MYLITERGSIIPLNSDYRAILYNTTKDHTFVSLQVNFNSKLQIVLDAIKIKNYQLPNLLKIPSDSSALSGNFQNSIS